MIPVKWKAFVRAVLIKFKHPECSFESLYKTARSRYSEKD